MGKYMRKSKLTTDVVAVVDVTQSSLGVRTRAKTLALQKLQAASRTTDTPPPEQRRELSYLQLRSRKLEKPSTCYTQQIPNPSLGTSRLAIRSCGSVSAGSGSNNQNVRAVGESQMRVEEETVAYCDFGTEETSFGENNVDFDGRERSTRESTPCSFIRDSNAISTPASSTRPTNRRASNQILQNSIQRIMPSAQEIEGFFARHALEQQRLFSKKYNFDIVNGKPLQGRYEWVRVQP